MGKIDVERLEKIFEYINIVRREVARYYCALHMCANETRRIVYENIGLSQI